MSFRIHSLNLGVAQRAARTLGALALLLALATPASAVLITDVRVGLHKTFTRVVLETDTPARYRITKTAGGEIQVQLGAEATPRRIVSRSDLLSEVVVVPGQQSTIARLRLRGGDVKINELILMNPPRIVLDLRGTGAPVAVTKTPPAPAPKAKAKPPPAPRPEAVPKATPRTGGTAGTTTQLADRARDAAHKTTGDLIKEATEKAQTTRLTPQEAAAAARERADALAKASAGAPGKTADAATQKATDLAGAAQDKAAGITGTVQDDKAAGTAQKDAAGTAQDDPAALAAAAREKARIAAEKARTLADAGRQKTGDLARDAAETATSDSSPLPAFLRDPVVLGGLGLAIALALGIFFHQRRSGREDDYLSPAAADEPFSVDEGSVDEGAIDERSIDESAAGVRGLGAAAAAANARVGSAFSTPEADDEPTDEFPGYETSTEDGGTAAMDIGMDTSTEAGLGSMPSVGGANADVMRMFQELERRVTMVEKRLEETTEAKERLERQVAAQTEELRVQRSAIARTQRALRSIARPDEEATEPVPKG